MTVAVDRFQGFAFNPVDLAEDVELDVERRKEILHLEAEAARLTHYEVLGLAWNADAAAAKAAYLERVKVFHPDRYPGKRLGSYRARLERCFRRLTEARDVLVDDAKRTTYARQVAPPEEFARNEARRLEDERRAEERRARLARQNPLMARAARAGDLLKRAREALAAEKFQQALNDFLVVVSMDPANKEAAALAEEARRKLAAQRSGDLVDKGMAAEAMGNHATAVALYRQALDTDPTSSRAAMRGARAALAVGDAASALEFGVAAVKANPRSGAAHEAHGLALVAAGQSKEARKILERALELDPSLDQAKAALKKSRWSLLG